MHLSKVTCRIVANINVTLNQVIQTRTLQINLGSEHNFDSNYQVALRGLSLHLT